MSKNTAATEKSARPIGIFCRHPDTDKPNFLMAEMLLDSLDFEKKRIGALLTAIHEKASGMDEALALLIGIAHSLNEDRKTLRSLRSALCLANPGDLRVATKAVGQVENVRVQHV